MDGPDNGEGARREILFLIPHANVPCGGWSRAPLCITTLKNIHRATVRWRMRVGIRFDPRSGRAQPDVPALKEAGDIKGLIGLLSHPDFDTQWKAAEALAALGERATLQLLLEIDHHDPAVRLGIIEALGDIRDPLAVGPLSRVLEEDASIEVRWATALALGNIGDGRAIPSLVAALGDPDKYVRIGAAIALERIGWEPGNEDERALFLIAKQDWPAVQRLGPPAVSSLESFMKDGDPSVREAVVDLLGSIGDPRAGEVCALALQDPEGEVRWKATLAFPRCGIPVMHLPMGLARRSKPGNSPFAAALINLFFLGLGYDYLERWYGILIFQLDVMIITLASLVWGPLLPYLASFSVSSLVAVQTWYSASRMREEEGK